MCPYATELESAKLLALQTLTALLATTEDPIEKRRIATTILRIPIPKPDRATDRATGCPGVDGQPVQSTPRARTNENSPSPELPTQDTGPTTQDSPSPHPTSAIPHPTFPTNRLDAEYQQTLKDLLENLSSPLSPLCASASPRETLPDSSPEADP